MNGGAVTGQTKETFEHDHLSGKDVVSETINTTKVILSVVGAGKEQLLSN